MPIQPLPHRLTPAMSPAAADDPGALDLQRRWWTLLDFRIGIIPLPIYLVLFAMMAGRKKVDAGAQG